MPNEVIDAIQRAARKASVTGGRSVRLERSVYSPPQLTRYGKVRELTAAPSPGQFESGAGLGYRI